MSREPYRSLAERLRAKKEAGEAGKGGGPTGGPTTTPRRSERRTAAAEPGSDETGPEPLLGGGERELWGGPTGGPTTPTWTPGEEKALRKHRAYLERANRTMYATLAFVSQYRAFKSSTSIRKWFGKILKKYELFSAGSDCSTLSIDDLEAAGRGMFSCLQFLREHITTKASLLRNTVGYRAIRNIFRDYGDHFGS